MSTTVARINAVVTANTTQFTAAMQGAEKQTQSFRQKAAALGRMASKTVTAGLLAAGGAAVKAATDFESSMAKIESLVGIAGDEVDAMKDSVLDLAGETARAPGELADAMFFIQSAGLRGATAMETLEASAKAAAVGLGDAATIADLATSALNAYGAENLSATGATDVLAAAVREGKLEAGELAGSMGRVLPIASAMGVRFDEVGAAFAALSRTGTNAAEAATQVRGILSSLLRPTKQAEEALTGMGLSSEGLRQQIKDEGLLATLQTLAEEFDGNAAASASVFGNVRALSGVMDLMGANVETTEAIFASMTDTTGTLDNAFAVASDTAEFKFRQAMAELQATFIEVGTTILPVVLSMLDGVQAMISAFLNLPGPVKAATAALVGLVALSGPIGLTVAAVGGLMWAVGKLGEESERAKERQASLSAEFEAAGTPTTSMIDRMRELADAIRDAEEASGDMEGEVGSLVGSQTALAMAMDMDLLPAFADAGVSMDDVAAAAEGGTDAFQALQRTVMDTSSVDAMRIATYDLTGAEKELADSLIDAYEAGNITRGQLVQMTDVVDETADAFDDNREALAKASEEFIKSADAAKLLNDANLDGVALLTKWADAGKSYVEQAELIDIITQDVSHAMDTFNVEAARAGAAVDSTAAIVDDARSPIDELVEGTLDAEAGFAALAEQTDSFRSAFEELMGAIVFEGEALNNTQLLIDEMAGAIDDLAAQSLPEARDSFFDFAQQAAGQIGELRDAGIELGGAEMQGAVDGLLGNLLAIADEAAIPAGELAQMQRTLLEMAGLEVPIRLRIQTENLPTFIPEHIDGVQYFGATGAVVRQPTMALIGEAGPEAVVPLSSAPGASPLPGGGMDGGAMNVTVNMPAGADGDDVVRALQDYVRRRGALPVAVGSARY